MCNQRDEGVTQKSGARSDCWIGNMNVGQAPGHKLRATSGEPGRDQTKRNISRKSPGT